MTVEEALEALFQNDYADSDSNFSSNDKQESDSNISFDSDDNEK